jgi:hypothetical protein
MMNDQSLYHCNHRRKKHQRTRCRLDHDHDLALCLALQAQRSSLRAPSPYEPLA